tara:strand:+ start:3606 stop:5165 length:1560 start_codon:yes stop_codon:yes gene_type:complete
MPSENYDFVPWDSHNNIHEFFNSDDIDKAFFAPLLARLATSKVGQAVASQGVKGALKTGAKNITSKVGTGLKNLKAKVGVKGGGAVTEAAGKTAAEGATSAAKTAAKGASEAVESVAPKPKLGEKMPSAEVTTPEPPAAEPAAEMPEPEEPSGSAGKKADYKKIGMQLAQQSQANAAQKKQAQEQRAMDMARRGASVQTGEPMKIAFQLLKEMAAYDAEHPVELKSVASSPYINEACTLCPNPNALISLRYTNPTFTKDYTHHMCYECAKQYDVHDMIHPAALSPSDYDVKLAGKPIEIAYQLLKTNFNEYFGTKDSWVSLPKEGMDAKPELYGEVADAMNISYEAAGGHSKYKNADDLQEEQKHHRYDMIDNDEDPFVDAAHIYSQREQGFKSSVTAHDGSREGKNALKNHMYDHLKIPGHYAETSGAWASVLEREGMPSVTDYDHIRELVNKPISESDNGRYMRDIGGEEHEKQLHGTPMREGADWTQDFLQQSLSAHNENKPFFLQDYNFLQEATQ